GGEGEKDKTPTGAGLGLPLSELAVGLTSAETGAGLVSPLVSAAAVTLPPAMTATLPTIAHVWRLTLNVPTP
ncbi:hypothetical protein ACFVX9_17855, partial [Kitasatospora sp. NPDC058243]|uniref:hypothetical protein n=1 Tax=Kitasatospora sp. NPDC058243 TaxID=3346397 RepID=UPI0036DE0624